MSQQTIKAARCILPLLVAGMAAAASPAKSQTLAADDIYQKFQHEFCSVGNLCDIAFPAPTKNRVLRVTNANCKAHAPTAGFYRTLTLFAGSNRLELPFSSVPGTYGPQTIYIVSQQVDYLIGRDFSVRIGGDATGHYSLSCTITGELIPKA